MRLSRHLAAAAVALTTAGCTHSDAFVSPVSPVYGPFSSGPTVQLSFNSDQDYWPAWTDDGRGILYAFVDGEGVAPPKHRCIGLLPAAGGSRIWQLCDNRAVRDDTVSSYGAYALNSDGKLLVAEATAPANLPFEPLPRISLWLADTAKPYIRTTLLTLPQTVDGFGVTWIADLAWTGPNTFIALGQQLVTLPHCGDCLCAPCPKDSIFGDAGMVITGTISGGSARLHAIAGTDSATSYSLAENGASIVFTRHHDLRLFKVPVGGGAPMPLPPQSTIPDTAAIITGELAGVSCKGSTCIVASNGVFLTDAYTAPCAGGVCEVFASFLTSPLAMPMTLQSVSLVSGAVTILASDSGPTSQVFASPRVSPNSGDVVVQRGGVWGHLQTFATLGRGNGHLFLMKGVVP